MLYVIILWNSEWNKKKHFASKIKVKQTKNDYQRLIDNLPSGLLITDSFALEKVLYVNTSLASLLGIPGITDKSLVVDSLK